MAQFPNNCRTALSPFTAHCMQFIIRGHTSPTQIHHRGPSLQWLLAIALLLFSTTAPLTVLRLDNGSQSDGQTTLQIEGHEQFNESQLVVTWSSVAIRIRSMASEIPGGTNPFMAAEQSYPATHRMRVDSGGSWQEVSHSKTVSEQMDDDLEAISGSAAAAATRKRAEAQAPTDPAHGPTMGPAPSRPPGLAGAHPQRVGALRDVVVDPRLLTKPNECPTERGTTWRLWRTKLEGWIYGLDVRMGQALEEAAEHASEIAAVPIHLRQASAFIYAELLGATTGVQMETVLEVSNRNGFEAWRRLVREMERDTVNRKLAIIEALSRPDFGCETTQWRQRWRRWERELNHYLPTIGSAMSEAMKIAIVRQRAPADVQKHLKLNAMVYGEKYAPFHDMIEAYFGADEDEPMDNTYSGLEVGYVAGTPLKKDGDRCRLCGKMGHWAKDCRSSGKNISSDKSKGDGKGMSKGKQYASKGDGKQSGKNRGMRCFKCGKEGHQLKDCRGREACFKCGKPGHRQEECKEVHEVEQEPRDSAWCFAMEIQSPKTEHSEDSTLELAVDSGTEVHIIPFRWVRKTMKWVRGPDMVMRGAGGEQLRHYGRVEVLLEIKNKLVKLYLEVVDARRALLSVSAMLDAGWQVGFAGELSTITCQQNSIELVRRGGLYLLEGKVRDARELRRDQMPEVLVMPVETESALPMLAEDAREPQVALQAREAPSPELPDTEVIRRHELTHATMEPWCATCVRARGRDDPHHERDEEEKYTMPVDELPMVQLDYTFVDGVTILDMYVDTVRSGAGTVVEKKGATRFAVQWTIKKMEQFGLKDVKMRTDAEHAITALAKEIKRQRQGVTNLQVAPEADHQAIGGVERFHRIMQDQMRALKMQVETNLGVILKADAATTKWLVRHAAWIIFRFANSKILKSTAYFRVFHKNFSGTLVNLFETVLARKAEDATEGRRTSKWDSRWRIGVWLGKTELSDEHLVYVQGEVTHHRTIRRFAENDPRRWMKEDVMAMRVTPWCIREADEPERGPVTTIVPNDVRPPSTTSTTHRIRPMRRRPLTPGCAACAHTGQPSHGYRHSVVCRNELQKWLNQQLGPPVIHEPPTISSEVALPRKKLTRKQPPPTSLGKQTGTLPMDVEDETIEQMEQTEVPMMIEDTPASTAVKRPAEGDPGEDDEKMVQTLEILQAEVHQDEAADEQQIMLEAGDWCPVAMAWEGDVKEVQGLFDKGVFERMGNQRPEGRYISMRMIRRWKGEVIKSRLCLQDVAYFKMIGGDLFAATPSLMALRVGLALASAWRREDPKSIGVVASDVTQAFVHADMDEAVITRVPRDLNNMEITAKDETIRLEEGDWLRVLKALYGYRKSPKLWQTPFFQVLQNLKSVALKCLETEPAMCADMNSKVIVVIHVDDVLMLGNVERCDLAMNELKTKIKIHETGRGEKTGDTLTFVGKLLTLTDVGYLIQGSKKVIDATIETARVEKSKKVDTPLVAYTHGQQEAAEELDREGVHEYRSLLGKEMYVAWDRPDIQYATNVAARSCARPTTMDMMRVKRIARYLAHRRELLWCFEAKLGAGNEDCVIEVWTDSDWAGNGATRRSTSGGLLFFQKMVIKTWAKLQSILALSSAEAEYLAMIKGVQEALALRTALMELGITASIVLYTDSAAAKGSAEKPGLMHMKHMQIRELFLKQIVQQGLVTIQKIDTKVNPADLFTKAVKRQVFDTFWETTSTCWRRNFEVNLIERDFETERAIRRQEEHNDSYQWFFLVWSALACTGLVWLITMLQKMFGHGGAVGPSRSSSRPTTSRVVACQSMSTWLRGVTGRFSMTRAVDQGVFCDDMNISTNIEKDGVPRDINERVRRR